MELPWAGGEPVCNYSARRYLGPAEVKSRDALPDQSKEVLGPQIDTFRDCASEKAGLVPAWHEAVGASDCPAAGPLEHGGAVQVEPEGDLIDTTATVDDGGSGLHGWEDCGTSNSLSSPTVRSSQGTAGYPTRYVQGMASQPHDPEEIRRRLVASGMSQASLARALKLAPSAVTRMLNGQRQIKAHEMAAIGGFFDGVEQIVGDLTPFQKGGAAAIASDDVLSAASLGCSQVMSALIRVVSNLPDDPQPSEPEWVLLDRLAPFLGAALVLRDRRLLSAEDLGFLTHLNALFRLIEDKDTIDNARTAVRYLMVGAINSWGSGVEPVDQDDPLTSVFIIMCSTFTIRLLKGPESGADYVAGLAEGIRSRPIS